jgi:hypothetical protein
MTARSSFKTTITPSVWSIVGSVALALLTISGGVAHAQEGSANLGLTAGQASVSTVNPAVVTTFWSVANRGPSSAVDVMLRLTLPTGTSLTSAYVQAGIPACTWDAATTQVTCAFGPLDSGITTSATVTIANTGNPAGTQLTVQAQLTSGTPDPVSADNSASTTITPQGGPLPMAPTGPSANLGLSATTPGLQQPGPPPTGFLSWGLFNAGPDQAEGVTVVFTLPEGITYIDATVAARTAPCPFDPATLEVSCTLPGIFGSGTTTSAGVQFSLDGVAASRPFTIVAQVRSSTVDPDLTDNVRPNTFGGSPLPSTGTHGSAIAIMAAFALATGLVMLGAARRSQPAAATPAPPSMT